MKETNVKKYAEIYVITCVYNKKQYVGWTVNGSVRRFHVHISQAKRKTSNSILHKAIRKYGEDQFIVETVYTTKDSDHAREMEIYFIQKFNTFYLTGYGYNMTLGGDGTVGHKMSDENKRKLSARMKGVAKSSQHKMKISQSNMGKEMSSESKLKMSISKKGRPHSREHIQKHIEARLGRAHTPETIQKMRDGWTPERRAETSKRFTELPRTEEHRRKIGAALKGKSKPSNRKGCKLTPDQLEKNRQAQLKRFAEHPISDETKAKMSAAGKGRKQDPIVIENRAVRLRGRKNTSEQIERNRQGQLKRFANNPMSEEIKLKMQIAKQNYLKNHENSSVRNWVIWHKDDDAPFLVRNLEKWAAERGFRADSFQQVAKGKRNSVYGFRVWRLNSCPQEICAKYVLY